MTCTKISLPLEHFVTVCIEELSNYEQQTARFKI
jgi:hypothetical protein